MKSQFVLSCLFLALTRISLGQAQNNSCAPFQSRNTVPRCGEIFTTGKDTIFYKPYTKIDSHERCVWVIEADFGNQTADFHVLFMGYPGNPTNENGPRLTVSTFTYENQIVNTVINGTGHHSIFVYGYAFLTFSAGDLTDASFTGFILTYSIINGFSQHSTAMVLPAVYFQNTQQYNGIYSALVIPPDDNYYPGGAYPLTILEGQFSGQCNSKAYVYHYNNALSTNPWQLSDTICEETPTKIISGHPDIVLVLVERNFPSSTFFNMMCEV